MSVYNIENYQDFDPQIGIHDTLKDEFFDELRALPVWKMVPVQDRLLDDLSKSLYETELLWWTLMYYNDILDPLSFNGLTIQAPSKSDLETLLLKYKVSRANSQ